ncbi:hypothetical protein VE00_01280 [Pseudogymnoascus sp. WSF 3629]|nr:hypothetical protein VE00_01280 [Pseudogymnoascus sp. WSF 3629]
MTPPTSSAAAPKKVEKSYLSSAVESMSPWTSARPATPKPAQGSGMAAEAQAQAAQRGGDHSVGRSHGISTRRYPEDCPPLKTKWFYAVDFPKRKPKLLKDVNIETKPLPTPKKYLTFSSGDSQSIEKAYQKFIEDEEDEGQTAQSPIDLTTSPESKPGRKENSSLEGDGSPRQRRTIKVPVNEDYLFDVDIEERELAPVYWLGPIYDVRRGTWFYQEGSTLRPCDENLATQLEEGYLKVKPFRYPKPAVKDTQPKTADEAKLPTDMGAPEVTPKASAENLKGATEKAGSKPTDAAHQPQTHRLFGSYMNSIVTYQDDTVAWLSDDGIVSRMSTTVYQRFAGGGYMSGVKIVRGYTKGEKTSTDAKTEVPLAPEPDLVDEPDKAGLRLDERQQRLLKRRSAPAGTLRASDIRDLHAEAQKPALSGSSTPKSEEAIRKLDEKEIRDDYQDHPTEDQSREIEHLILVTHGIGQRLGMRTESVNFIHDVNVLRQTLKSVYGNSADLQALNSEIDKLPKNCRIQVLPVCWRHLLDFPRHGLKQNRKEHDLADISSEDEEYPSLDDITVEGVPFVRSLITDLALDVLLYQSAYREHISNIVLRECNRVYKLFLDRNPDFNGKVSLIGHSLGSAIFFDILCRQKEDKDTYGLPQHPKFYHNRPGVQPQSKKDGKDMSFDFDVEDFYCLGSPIGLFQMLKGRTIAARHHPEAMPAQSPMDLDMLDDPFLAANSHPNETFFPTSGFPYSISSPKCAQLYNIFHPSDPIAYRLEPLIAPAMSSLKPQALPYTKKGIFNTSAAQGITGIGARVGQSVSGLWSSFSSGIASSLLNRSLGLTGEDIAKMERAQGQSIRESPLSMGAGTNISGGGVIADTRTLTRENTNEKQRQLAEDTANADREGNDNAPTLIDDDIETLYSGFQKRRKSHQGNEESNKERIAADEKAKQLRREEMKVRGLNENGRIDFSIQESVLDFNPYNTIASHLSYWGDEDVCHFMQSQLLSRHRAFKRRASMDLLKS